jgi:DNA-binding LacI/PurR family transcriptional regulator
MKIGMPAVGLRKKEVVRRVKAAERIVSMRSNDRPTAVLAANDMLAIGLTSKLQSEGLKIPDDISVVGFDNIEWSRWTTPPLTTIAQPIQEMVSNAAKALMDRIASSRTSREQLPPSTYCAETKLVIRDTVRKLQSRKTQVSRVKSTRSKL